MGMGMGRRGIQIRRRGVRRGTMGSGFRRRLRRRSKREKK
jgi:hypothetical protein